MKRLFLIFLCLNFLFSAQVRALDTTLPNNKFGIHLAQPSEQDIKRASELVNSSGGKWGYVTLVMQENDRNREKWENVFNQLRKFRLVPIIRLATMPDGAKWKRPRKEDIDSWVKFLSSLNWVTKDRYIILFNEVNHGAEWGGQTDPEGYAELASELATKLEDSNKDFFIMLAGLDAAAPSNPPQYEDEAIFLERVFQKKPELKDKIEGLSSHSYPNLGFVGSPYDTGRNTIKTYEWELELLKQLGVSKTLPVFITETGWPHREASTSNQYFSTNVLGEFTRIAFENVWLIDQRVIAVTPFILNYQGEPFSAFSWIMPGESEVYPHYEEVVSLPKSAGEPDIIEKGKILFNPPNEILIKSTYHFNITLENNGQALWTNDTYSLKLDGIEGERVLFGDIPEVAPGQSATVDLFMKTGSRVMSQKTQLALYRNNKKVLDGPKWDLIKLPLPSLTFRARLAPKLSSNSKDVELQIFDDEEQLVFKKKGLGLSKAQGTIEEVQNIALNKRYRAVLLVPYYLPRQTYLKFRKGENNIRFRAMIPLDFDLDGRFSLGDIGSLFTHPDYIRFLLP